MNSIANVIVGYHLVIIILRNVKCPVAFDGIHFTSDDTYFQHHEG